MIDYYTDYFNVMFNPLSYIDAGRFQCHHRMLDTAYGHSVANNIIINQYKLSVVNFELTTRSRFIIQNWPILRDIVFYTGCQVLKSEFIQQGRFMSLPKPALAFLKNTLIPADIKPPKISFDGRHESILSTGYAVFMPAMSLLPLPLRQRIILCFPPYVDEQPTSNAVSPIFISLVTRYAKNNPLKLRV